MDASSLEQIGLSRNEAIVYLALLREGETKTGALFKSTGMHRVLIYDALESLIRKGLASYAIKENRKYFQAADPGRLVDFTHEKEEAARSLVPSLQAIKAEGESKQSVSVYEGMRGLKSALNNMLKELSPGGSHEVFASGNMADMMGAYYDLYQQEKRRNKIRAKIMYDEEFRTRRDVLKRTVGKVRFYRLSHFPTDTWIYNDKVLIVTYTASPPVAILIVSKETADSYRRIFNGFWKNARG